MLKIHCLSLKLSKKINKNDPYIKITKAIPLFILLHIRLILTIDIIIFYILPFGSHSSSE